MPSEPSDLCSNKLFQHPQSAHPCFEVGVLWFTVVTDFFPAATQFSTKPTKSSNSLPVLQEKWLFSSHNHHPLKKLRHIFWMGLLLLGSLPVSTFAQIEAIDSLIAKARREQDPALKSDLLVDAGKQWRKSNLDSAEKYLVLAHQFARQSGDDDRTTRCQVSLGVLYWIQGKLDLADATLEKALEYWKNQNNEVEITRCLLNLGTVNQANRKNEKALNYLRQSGQLAAKLGEAQMRGQAAGSAATVFFQMEEPDSVMAYSEIAYQAFKQLGDSANMARAQSNLGYYFAEMGRSQEARAYYHIALDLIAHIDDKSLRGEINEGLGKMEYGTGNYDQAVTHTLIARQMFRELGWLKRIAGNDVLLGNTFKILGRNETARHHLEEAYRLADSLSLNEISASALSSLAEMYADAGDCPKSIRTFRQSLTVEAKGPHTPYLFHKHLGMSKCFRLMGLQDSASWHLDKAFASARASGHHQDLGNGFNELAQQALAQNKYNQTMALLDSAMYWYSVDVHPKGLFEVWELRSRTLEAMGDFVGALAAQRNASQWQDSVFTAHATEQLLTLEAKYWSEKKEHSLAMARQNAVMQEIEADRALEASDKLAAQRNLLISALVLTLIFGGLVYYLNLKRRENKLQNRITELRMTALRAQMNPHFIFNALGSVQLLINTQDVRGANLYLTKFARLLRIVLENSSQKEVPLEDELESLKLYVELEALRFKFQYEIEVKKDIQPSEVQIPSMLLQPIVENAVKHGLAGKKEAGRLIILIEKQGDELVCLIQDNGIGREKAQSIVKEPQNKTSMGTRITQERLSQLSPQRKDRLSFTDLKDEAGNPIGTQVYIRLPYHINR